MKPNLISLFATVFLMVFCMLWAPGVQAQHKVAFVTSVAGNGNLGDATEWPDSGGLTGLAAADKVCQNRALAAGLANHGDFVAWLSNSGDDAYCRVHNLSGKKATNCGQATLPAAAGPWIRTDGVIVAVNKADLLDSLIRSSIHVTEDHQYELEDVFTGSRFTGSGTSDHCGNWTNGVSGNAETGNTGWAHANWSSIGPQPCNEEHRIYCFSNATSWPFFTDRFESGDLRWWSSVAGD